MAELEYNGKRYIVDGGQWYRRLEVGEVKPEGYQRDDTDIQLGWRNGVRVNDKVEPFTFNFRVPCTDPRPAFEVGQRVRVARKDETGCISDIVGVSGFVASHWAGKECAANIQLDGRNELALIPVWCLDLVEQQPLQPVAQPNVLEFTIDGKRYKLRCSNEEPDEPHVFYSCPVPQIIQDAINERLGKPTGETE